jgi:hypothetical protein
MTGTAIQGTTLGSAGSQTSWHLFTGSQAAADFDELNVGLRTVFDWICLESKLPFEKCILETSASGVPRCIHIQIERVVEAEGFVSGTQPPRRFAYKGNTGAGTVYVPVQVV